MGKAARNRAKKREKRDEIFSKTHLMNVTAYDPDTFAITYVHDDFPGVRIVAETGADAFVAHVSDPLNLASPRPAADREFIEKVRDEVIKRVGSAFKNNIERTQRLVLNRIRSYIWQSDLLRKRVRQYDMWFDEYIDDDGCSMMDSLLAFSVAVGPKRYASIWYEGGLFGTAERCFSLGHYEDEAQESDRCAHCAYEAGKIALVDKETFLESGEHARELADAIDPLVAGLREDVLLVTLPALVDDLAFPGTKKTGTWAKTEIEYKGPRERGEAEDALFQEIGDALPATYRYESTYRPEGAPVVYKIGDDDVEETETDIEPLLVKPGSAEAGKWELPDGYGEIEHGTVYIDDLLSDRPRSSREQRIVLTDSVDSLVLLLDPATGVQKVEDRSLFDKEDPTELERFAMRCEELFGDGEAAALEMMKR